jgi:hypothetical protein
VALPTRFGTNVVRKEGDRLFDIIIKISKTIAHLENTFTDI